MALDLNELKGAYEVEIKLLSTALLQAKARAALEEYIDARAAVNGLQSHQVQSYTVSNRTFTYKDLTTLRSIVNELQSNLESSIYGSVTLVDANMGSAHL